MACELLACCRFFDDIMKDMPMAKDYIKQKFCFAEYTSCNRYVIFTQYGGGKIPSDFDPDVEEVEKILQCLRQKQLNHSRCMNTEDTT